MLKHLSLILATARISQKNVTVGILNPEQTIIIVVIDDLMTVIVVTDIIIITSCSAAAATRAVEPTTSATRWVSAKTG